MCCWADALPAVYKDNLSYEAAHRLQRRLEKQKTTLHTYYVEYAPPEQKKLRSMETTNHIEKKKDTTLYIGIDPDRDKNGVALYSSADRNLIDLLNLRFFELLDFLKAKQVDNKKIMVVIEAGWENEGNWHTVASDTSRKSAKIGKWVGGNHEVGRKIVEMVEYLGIPYMTIVPKRRKVDAKEFSLYTKWDKRTNQEQRDAAMLVIGF